MTKRDQHPLDVLDVPFDGMRVVEASAGTGKTHNITGLYLRLLLETDLTPERILVVTYTVAATAELRTRIRKGILEASEGFRHVRERSRETLVASPLVAALVDRFPDAEKAYRRLGNALRTFDEAAIFTIHGFCQRVLAESAFESGAPLASEMLGDQNELLAECIEDFWRRETYAGSPLWVRYLVEAELAPERLRGEIASLVGRPFEEVLVPHVPDTTADEAAYADLFDRARALWATERDTVHERLGSKGLNGNKYRPKSVAGWIDAVDLMLCGSTPSITLFERFARLTPAGLEEGTNRNQETPTHPFFDLCGEIAEVRGRLEPAYDARRAQMRARLLAFCNDEIRRKKRERRVRWFDDLLLDLDDALQAESTGAALAGALRERYGAALIDEFQDTDPLQYSIFRRIYGEGDEPVFLVGDPKQAIYAFRGADVFAYLRARDGARARYTLDENWRSDRGVVEGVNAVFGAHDNPFVLEEIPYHPVRPHFTDRAKEALSALGLPPVRAWFLPRGDDGKLRSTDAKQWIADATADEIVRLLESGIELPGDDGVSVPIHGGHIAVLVRSHPQGQQIRRALSARGVAAVEESQDSVFGSEEAEELERVLAAIAEPADERLVRGALATTLLGVTAERLVELAESAHDWDREVASFQDDRRAWLSEGFGQMFRRLLRRRRIPERLLAGPEGERRLTNLLQIGELLTGEATTEHRGADKLLQWLATRRTVSGTKGVAPMEHLLRLESDDNLVQINTLHGSKGLEYPIVFVPFAWSTGGGDRNSPHVTFHQADTPSGRPFIDFGSDEKDAHERLAEREDLAEDLRLLYVALTRAKHHCTFGWGAVQGEARSAPAWLLHPETRRGGEGSAPLELPYQDLDDAELLAALQKISADSGGDLSVVPLARKDEDEPHRISLPASTAGSALAARTISRDVRPQWRITSFSALRGGRSVDHPDRDGRAALPDLPAEPARDLFGFPKGARPGVCLHELFEHWDFTEADPERLRALVESTLDQFGFPSFWTPTIEKMMRDVLATPLDSKGTLRLADVSNAQRLNEVEFHYPAGRLTLEGLNELMRVHGYPGVPDRGPDDDLPKPLVDGYVKGYIDLVFEADGRYYLADYKSNWLGQTFDDYRPEALDAVVRQELYTLQYVTYTLALHRFLRLRLSDYDYDRDVGGAYYLFLRGMQPDRGPSSGIFFDRPPRALIEELDERIGTGQARGAGAAR